MQHVALRPEAVHARSRLAAGGEVLRFDSRLARWVYQILLLAVAVGLVLALVLRIHEYASGPAVVRVDGRRAVTTTFAGTVERVLASDLWQRARAAAELHAEVPVAVRLEGDGASPPRVLHGVIDLAFRGPDGWELVDYKTDQADVATLAAQYGDQVRQYARQWATLTGTPVATARIYAVRDQAASPNLLEA